MNKNTTIPLLIAAALIALAFWLGCNHGVKSVLQEVRHDTIVKNTTDTFRTQPTETGHLEPIIKYVDKWHDGAVTYEPGKPYPVYIDTSGPYPIKEITDYNTIKYNIDTAHKDLVIWDTLFRNKNIGRSVSITRHDTTIYETKILKPKQRTVGYFAVGGLGNVDYIGGRVGLGLKNKIDFVYEANVTWINGIKKPFWGGSVFVPIRLKKQKK